MSAFSHDFRFDERMIEIEAVPVPPFRPPELGQSLWSISLLDVHPRIAMLNPKLEVAASQPPRTLQIDKEIVSTFSEAEIRVRAYQIYESRDRNGDHAAEDWNQAKVELMEMVGGK